MNEILFKNIIMKGETLVLSLTAEGAQEYLKRVFRRSSMNDNTDDDGVFYIVIKNGIGTLIKKIFQERENSFISEISSEKIGNIEFDEYELDEFLDIAEEC